MTELAVGNVVHTVTYSATKKYLINLLIYTDEVYAYNGRPVPVDKINRSFYSGYKSLKDKLMCHLIMSIKVDGVEQITNYKDFSLMDKERLKRTKVLSENFNSEPLDITFEEFFALSQMKSMRSGFDLCTYFEGEELHQVSSDCNRLWPVNAAINNEKDNNGEISGED